MDRALKVGVIGVGTVGKRHLRAFKFHKNADVVAVADTNEKALKSAAKEFNVDKAFTDYHDLLALDELEAVAVCTPPFNHALVTCEAASAGKQVLCEKPMAIRKSLPVFKEKCTKRVKKYIQIVKKRGKICVFSYQNVAVINKITAILIVLSW
jgi:threonine dehydrogenase-like Zn-dependent dehydrogenase